MANKNVEKRIFTVPNILSMLRILVVPIYAYLYLSKHFYVASALMLASMITDSLDGIIARKYNLITNLGKFLDPFADKLTQGVILVCLMINFWGCKPFLMVVCVFALKEMFMFIMGAINLFKGRMLNGALFAGKVCTTVLFVGFMLFMVHPNMPESLIWIISVICTGAMLVSLFSYVNIYIRADSQTSMIKLDRKNR